MKVELLKELVGTGGEQEKKYFSASGKIMVSDNVF